MNEADMSVIFISARQLSNEARKNITIETLSRSKTITQLAEREYISRRFLRLQKKVTIEAMDEAFADILEDSSLLFNLLLTKVWGNQVALGLALICHRLYRGEMELLSDVVGISVIIGMVRNLIQKAASQAAPIIRSQDLGAIRVAARSPSAHRRAATRRALAGLRRRRGWKPVASVLT